MSEVAVVYHSATGTTKRLAEALRDGAASIPGVHAGLHAIEGKAIAEGRWRDDALLAALDRADAIAFGCPTFMGGPSAQMKAFLDATVSRWYTRSWRDKLAAGFTVSSTPSGDKLQTLTAIAVTAMQHGMVWVGLDQSPIHPQQPNRLGVYLGVAAQAEYGVRPPGVIGADLKSGELLGARLARLAARLRASAR